MSQIIDHNVVQVKIEPTIEVDKKKSQDIRHMDYFVTALIQLSRLKKLI